MKARKVAKWSQMAGETSTAISQALNEGNRHGISKVKGHKECVFCAKAYKANTGFQIEHVIDKAKGGNHTKYNTFVVCNEHTKETGYSEDMMRVLKDNGFDEEKAKNPFYKESQEKFDVEEIRNDVKRALDAIAKKHGLDEYILPFFNA